MLKREIDVVGGKHQQHEAKRSCAEALPQKTHQRLLDDGLRGGWQDLIENMQQTLEYLPVASQPTRGDRKTDQQGREERLESVVSKGRTQINAVFAQPQQIGPPETPQQPSLRRQCSQR